MDARQPGRDLARGAALAALIGGSGLGLYLIAYHIGVELNVVAESLPDIWWRFPVLLLSAAQNATLEEVIVLGYLLSRLDRLGVRPSRAIALSAVIRGSYHLYQGVGGFFGNAVMGAIFGVLYRRWGRVTPLLIAHFLIDAVTFVGYALLAGHVSWLPPERGPPMNVLARLWDRVSGIQPLPPAWVVGLTGLVALVVVLNTRVWRLAGKVITIAHEGGHALVSVLSGRRLDGIRLHSDSSGVTYSRGKRSGPGLVLTAAAGYVMPSLLGAGAAWLLAAGT